MDIYCNWLRLTTFFGLAIGCAHAAPVEGRLGSNAAVLLFLLGVWALLMGMRNLRKLRHKHLIPGRQMRESEAGYLKDPDAPGDG